MIDWRGDENVKKLIDNTVSGQAALRYAATLRKLGGLKEQEVLKKSQTVSHLLDIPDDCMRRIFVMLAETGLARWCPDLVGNVTSDYNVAHIHVACETFRTLVRFGGYNHMRVVPYLANNDLLLKNLATHFVFVHMRKQYRTNLTNAKSPQQRAREKAIKQQRSRVCSTWYISGRCNLIVSLARRRTRKACRKRWLSNCPR